MNPESKTMLTTISFLIIVLALIGFCVMTTSCTYNIYLIDDPEKQQQSILQDSYNHFVPFNYYYKGAKCR